MFIIFEETESQASLLKCHTYCASDYTEMREGSWATDVVEQKSQVKAFRVIGMDCVHPGKSSI